MSPYRETEQGNEIRRLYQKAMGILKFNHQEEFDKIYKKLLKGGLKWKTNLKSNLSKRKQN